MSDHPEATNDDSEGAFGWRDLAEYRERLTGMSAEELKGELEMHKKEVCEQASPFGEFALHNQLLARMVEREMEARSRNPS